MDKLKDEQSRNYRYQRDRDSITKSDYQGGIDYAVEEAVVRTEEKVTKRVLKKQHEKDVQVALKLKTLSLPISQIADIVGLPIKEIENL